MGCGYRWAESIFLVLADREDQKHKEIKEEVAQLQPAGAADALTDDVSASSSTTSRDLTG